MNPKDLVDAARLAVRADRLDEALTLLDALGPVPSPALWLLRADLHRERCEPGLAAEALDRAARLLRHLQAILRLTLGQAFDEDQAPEGLKLRLAAAGNCDDFAALKDRLDAATSTVHRSFREVIEEPGGTVNGDETAGNTKEQ